MKISMNLITLILATLGGVAIATTSRAALIPAANLELWLQGDTGVVETSGRVSQWNDQSGNNNHLVQGNHAADGSLGIPVWTASANNPVKATVGTHGVVRFDGKDYLQNYSGFASGSSFSAFFVVDENGAPAKNTTAGGSAVHSVALMGATGYSVAGSNFAQSLEWADSGSRLGANFFTASLDIKNASYPALASTFQIVEVRKDNSAGGTSQLYVNGQLIGSGTGNQAVNSGIFLGGWAYGGLNGDIAEVLVYDAAIGTADRQLIEGILAWKYGLQASLPDDHPYQDVNPIPEPASLSLLLLGAMGWWRLKGRRRG